MRRGLEASFGVLFFTWKKFKFQTSVHDANSDNAVGSEEMKAIDCWLGVAGGTFERNRVILKTYLQQFVNLKKIVIFPDAGSITLDIKGSNGGVINCLTKEILKTRNVLVQDLNMSEDNIFVASWPEQRCQDSDNGLDIDDLLKTQRNINKIVIQSWKSFIAYLLGLANENVTQEQISNCVAATFAAQPGSQHHGHTIKTPETAIKDAKSESKVQLQLRSQQHGCKIKATETTKAISNSSSIENFSMYLYLVEVSKTYAGESKPFQLQNWHYITSKPSLSIKNPCQFDSSKIVVTDEFGFEEEERVRSSNRVVQQKVTILEGGASYKLPPLDMKLLAAADFL